MRDADFIGPPCECPECKQAGISSLPTRRDPYTGRMLHGYPLRRWYAAAAAFRVKARQAVGSKGRHQAGFEPLVLVGGREPGEDDL